MKEIDFQNFNDLKYNSSVVVFGAPWCKDCRFAEPILEELSNEYKNINFYHINVDKDEKIREIMQIRHIPTILYLKNGEEVYQRIVEPKSKIEIEKGLEYL